MRIGGLASGMNVDEIIEKLMTAERMPLDRMEQDKTTLTWKRNAFRDINLKLKELDDMILDMKLSKTYNPKNVTSSQEGAVTASASSSASNGTFKIEVEKLATAAMNIGEPLDGDFKPNAELDAYLGTHEFYTYDEEGEKETHTFEIKQGDTLNDVMKRITEKDNNVRMFYDEQHNRVILETTRTGDYNQAESGEKAPEIVFDSKNNAFFADFLKLDPSNETGGTNAEFTYNDQLKLESKDNNYTLNGITFNFTNETEQNSPAIITVDNDVDASFEKIKEFVDKYNEVVDQLNGTQREERYRDFKPLTEAQKEEMSEKQIEMWEEKAKSGILRGESIISDSLSSMRQSWYTGVKTDGEYTHLSQVGITTTKSYLDGGKLEIDEDKLKEALREDPQSVEKLFSNNVDGPDRGLINRLEDSIQGTMKNIEERAGKSYSTLEGYTLGKNMKDLNNRISAFEKKLVHVEDRYWRQFTAMEKAVQRMNQQSMQLLSQFGGQ